MAKGDKCELNLRNLGLFQNKVDGGYTPQQALQELEEELLELKRTDIIQSVVDKALQDDVKGYVLEYSGGKKSDYDLFQEGYLFSMVGDPSGRFKGENIHSLTEVMANRYTRPMEEYLDTLAGTTFSRSRNPKNVEDFWKEMDGIDTGNKDAKGLAKTWQEQANIAREEGNVLGANVGQYKGWVPTEHNPSLLLKAGFEGWKKDVVGFIDFKKSFPGANQAQIDNHLKSWFNNATGAKEDLPMTGKNPMKGLRRSEARARGYTNEYIDNMILANRRDNIHRVIHFKSAVDQGEYNKMYGTHKGDLSTQLSEALTYQARTNAMMKRFGPDPEGHWQKLVDNKDLDPGYRPKLFLPGLFQVNSEQIMRTMFGMTDMVTGVDTKRALFHQRVKAWITASSLGRTVLLSVPSDMYSSWTRAGLFDIGTVEFFMRRFQKLSPEGRRAIGHQSELLSNNSSAANRHADVTDVDTDINRIASGVLRGQGLVHATNWSKGKVAQALSHKMASNSDKTFDQLSDNIRVQMKASGIGSKDWDIIRKLGPEMIEGARYIKVDNLPIETQYRYLSLINREQDAGTPTATGLSRTITTRGHAKGTSERIQSDYFWQFKGTPLEEYLNMVGVLNSDISSSQKLLFTGKKLAGGLVTGFIILNIQSVAAGQGLIDITEMGPYELAMLSILCLTKAGGLGLFADNALETMFGDGYASSIADTILPPALSKLSQGIGKLGNLGTINEFGIGAYGNDILQFGLDNLPGQNLWMFQTFLDRGVKDFIEAQLDPRAAKRARNKVRLLRKKYKTEFLVQPGPFF